MAMASGWHRRSILLLAAWGLLAAIGCDSSPRARLHGRLFYADGNDVSVLDLTTGKRSKLTTGHLTLCSEGVCRMGSTIVTSYGPLLSGAAVNGLVSIALTGGVPATIGRGRFVGTATDHGPLVWYATRGGVPDTECVLVKLRPGAGNGVDTVANGPIGRWGAGVLHWGDMVLNPVAMDSGRVAFRGERGLAMVMDLRSNQVKPLGGRGDQGLPVLWRSRARRLVCFRGTTDWTASEFDADGNAVGRIPALDNSVGWAVVGEGDSVLFCGAHRGLAFSESRDLMLYDALSGRTSLVVPNVIVYRRAEFIAN